MEYLYFLDNLSPLLFHLHFVESHSMSLSNVSRRLFMLAFYWHSSLHPLNSARFLFPLNPQDATVVGADFIRLHLHMSVIDDDAEKEFEVRGGGGTGG